MKHTFLKIFQILIIAAAFFLVKPANAKAAITSAGTLGATSSKTTNQTSIVLTTTATAEVGNIIIVTIAIDNGEVNDGYFAPSSLTDVQGVSDSAGNTYTHAYNYYNSRGNYQQGAAVWVYFSKVTSQLSSGGTITADFNNDWIQYYDATAISAWEFTVGSGSTIQVQTQTPTNVVGGDPGSTQISGLASQEWLFFKGIAAETDNSTLTNTTNYTLISGANTTGSGEASNMSITGEFRIVTATSETSDPTLGDTSNDNTSLFIAFKEIPPPTISGTIYQTSNESSAFDCSSGGPYTVYIKVNGSGSYSGDCSLNTGAWSISSINVSSGQTIYAYIYGESVKGSTVLVSNGTEQTNVPIYIDRVSLRDDVNGSITNTEISAGNTADSDDLISFSGSDLTISSSYETHIYTGDTYSPGANVSTGKLHIVGNYSGSTETLTLTGSGTSTSRPLYINGGTFTAPSTTVFQGTSATDIESTTFNALTLNPTITSGISYTFLGTETINGDLNINPTAATSQTLTVNMGGTITVGATYTTTLSGTTSGVSVLDTRPVSADYNLSTGKINIAVAGTLDASGSVSTVTLTGTSSTLFTRVGTFTAGNSTVTVTSASGTPTLNSGTATFYNLTINPSSISIATSADDISVTNTLNVGSGDTLSLTSGQDLAHSGATLTLDGTISGSGRYIYSGSGTLPTSGTLSSIVRLDGTGADKTIVNRTYGSDLELYNSGSIGRNYPLGTGASQTVTISGNFLLMSESTGNVTVTGATNNPTVNITGNVDFTGTGGGSEAITSGTGIWTVSGNANFTGGTYTASAGNTLKMNGSSKSLTSASQTLQNFEISGGSVSTADAADINGTFSVTSGTFTQAANANLNVAGNFSLSSGTTFTKASGTGILRLDGDLTFTDSTATKQDLGNVYIGASPDTTNLASDMTATSLTVTSADFYYTNGYDLTIGTGGITVDGTFDATDDVETDETQINSAGSFTVNSTATFVPDQSTLTLNGTSGTSNIITDGSFSLYNLTINDGGNSLTAMVEDPLVILNNLNIAGGTLDVKTGENNQITIGGNFTNSDTFQARSGTVIFNDNTKNSTLSYSAATTFSGLTISTAQKHMFFDDTYQTNVTGAFTVQGTDCANLITLDSETNDNQWDIYVSGTHDVDFADIEDANAVTTSLTANSSTEANDGNTNWTINQGSCGADNLKPRIKSGSRFRGGVRLN